ncbi:CD3337/EF1877 family mobilome membrane protein [Bacillus cereus group sp. BfR-BA-01347]|uniref:CD3337/EF1877 family mobilome membrane protein n=1 Tax=Bacillus cereus group sp. BfR-BA-01347 TaxID=2920310 RepID=UPI001F561AEC|nr:hypothetical protein [Bacillus cereus group sp. BfR-BA-01347]
MKHKIKIWIALLTIICVTFIPFRVMADDSDEKVSPKHVESGGVKLDGKVFDYEQYEAVTHIKDSWNPFSSETLDRGLNAIANMFFSLTKMIAGLIDTAIEKLYSLSLVDQAADKIGKVSSLVYNNLFESLGILLITVAVIQIFIYYSVGKSGMKAGRATLQLLAVIAVATIWFANAGYYLKTLNGLSNEVQATIMKAGTPLADQKIKKGEELNGSLAILRNSYFNLVVKKSYLVMNYGTPDEKAITGDDKKGENRINDLLQYRVSKDGYKKRAEIAEKEADKLKNLYMAPSTVSTKIGVAVCAFAFSLILGIPLLVLAFLNVGVQILVLAFSTILGVSLLLALLPRLANSGWHNFERMVGLFFVKAFVGIAILFIFVLVQLMEGFIPPTTPDMYMLNIVATAACMFIVFKYRDKIIQVATGGKVSTVDGGMMKQAYEKGVKKPAGKITSLTRKGLEKVAGPAGKLLRKSGQGRNQQGNRQGGNEITSLGRSTQPPRVEKPDPRVIDVTINRYVDGSPPTEQSTEGTGRTKQNRPEGGNASVGGKENLKKQSSEEEKERTPQPIESEAEAPEGVDSTIEGKEHGSPEVSEQDQERAPQPIESEAEAPEGAGSTIEGKEHGSPEVSEQDQERTPQPIESEAEAPEGADSTIEGKEHGSSEIREQDQERTPQPIESEAEAPEGADSTIEGKEHGSPEVSEQDQERTPQPIESEAEAPEGADSTIEGKEHGSSEIREQDQERAPQPMDSETQAPQGADSTIEGKDAHTPQISEAGPELERTRENPEQKEGSSVPSAVPSTVGGKEGHTRQKLSEPEKTSGQENQPEKEVKEKKENQQVVKTNEPAKQAANEKRQEKQRHTQETNMKESISKGRRHEEVQEQQQRIKDMRTEKPASIKVPRNRNTAGGKQ